MERERMDLLSGKILIACIEVHKAMRPGLLEKIYEDCLVKELSLQGIETRRQVPVPLTYKGYELNRNYLIDILVEDEIILELKAVEALTPVFEAQVISYLKLADKKLGFLINFNVPLLKNGFRRFVNGF